MKPAGSPDPRELERAIVDRTAAAGFPVLSAGEYVSGEVRASLYREGGPGSPLLHPRVRLLAPESAPLDRLLGASMSLRMPELAEHVVAGRVYEHHPLRSERARFPERWVLDPRPGGVPERFKLWEVGGARVSEGPRRVLLLAVELQLRAGLRPWEGRSPRGPDPVPPWVERGRRVHVELLRELGGRGLERVEDPARTTPTPP